MQRQKGVLFRATRSLKKIGVSVSFLRRQTAESVQSPEDRIETAVLPI